MVAPRRKPRRRRQRVKSLVAAQARQAAARAREAERALGKRVRPDLVAPPSVAPYLLLDLAYEEQLTRLLHEAIRLQGA